MAGRGAAVALLGVVWELHSAQAFMPMTVGLRVGPLAVPSLSLTGLGSHRSLPQQGGALSGGRSAVRLGCNRKVTLAFKRTVAPVSLNFCFLNVLAPLGELLVLIFINVGDYAKEGPGRVPVRIFVHQGYSLMSP